MGTTSLHQRLIRFERRVTLCPVMHAHHITAADFDPVANFSMAPSALARVHAATIEAQQLLKASSYVEAAAFLREAALDEQAAAPPLAPARAEY